MSAAAPGAGQVYLARHGETAYNAKGRFQGHLPVPLDARGREQAAQLAELAAGIPFAALWCSPLARARETADVVGARLGLEPRDDARFAETECGDWTDRWFSDVQREDPEGFARFIAADPTFGFPGGESFAQQAERVADGLADVRRGPLPALVVCHRGVIRLALVAERGSEARALDEIGNAALVGLRAAPGPPRARR